MQLRELAAMRAAAGLSRRRLLLASATLGSTASHSLAQDRSDVETIDIAEVETATINGRHWDMPFVGGTTVDAVHRSVLIRIPAMAEAVKGALRNGRAIVGANHSISYDSYEIVPPGYTCRDGLGRKLWTENPPNWHVQAWPLRKPWFADSVLGPTFNADVNGRRFWSRYGAADTTYDRHVGVLDPQELSVYVREARIDI